VSSRKLLSDPKLNRRVDILVANQLLHTYEPRLPRIEERGRGYFGSQKCAIISHHGDENILKLSNLKSYPCPKIPGLGIISITGGQSTLPKIMMLFLHVGFNN